MNNPTRKRSCTQLKSNDVPKFREEILKRQNGVCPICCKVIKDPCLDHHHIKKIKGSGLIRGVLCRQCNTFIGKMENNCVRCGITQDDLPEILRFAAQYLEKKHLPYKHPSEKEKPKRIMKRCYNKLCKAYNGKAKLPDYPKNGRLTKGLGMFFIKFKIEVEYYGSSNE